MANFNVCYECLDERDDYHNILKQKRKEAIQNHVFNPFRGFEDNDQDDKEVDELMKELMSKFAEDECSELVSTTGYKSRRNDRDKLKAHAILEKLNWLDKCDRSNIKELKMYLGGMGGTEASPLWFWRLVIV
ncbi:hypothetical protein CC1G_14749 [Coprinopsis cinerea okayama7|uniref:Uncharacterized protein n=1 Tax=Coprinopsis cinerea (strain Okayama-7 / 130 / ATCC MYA-4618 / FGSC 9003) TaxID=240176 RepID=D6RNG5_COPC7|nr:hypothetical protein CC1G_14749 [Coprinopsis cinerea okayama7\|eukprot:XP_002910772.1 hypothetical protein CC1G_14749 [Coprinopsis cinerea okayama7\